MLSRATSTRSICPLILIVSSPTNVSRVSSSGSSVRIRILCRRSHAAKRDFKIRRKHLLTFRFLLNFQLVQQHLVQEDLANLSIDLPDLFVERRHDAFVFVKHTVGNCGEFCLQFLAIELVQRLATMTFKEAAQNVVQQFACVDRLEIERRFTARLESQHALRKEAIRTIAVDAETAGAVNEVRSKLLVQQSQQIRIGDLAVVRTKSRAGAFALDLDAPQRSVAEKTVVARERQQSLDSRLRQQARLSAAMQMAFLLAHETDFHFSRVRCVVEVLAVVIATDDLSFDSERRNRASQFVDVVRSDSFGIVSQQQRAREIQTLSRATSDLIKIVLFLQQRVGRNVFERQAVFSEPIAFFVRIDPIARRAQRKPAFDQSGDENCAKAQAANVGCFEHAQAVAIGRAKELRLRTERAAHFLKKR